ncbi:MAG: hypothetical protein D6707_10495, partial [Bacteroidetes bacterium]
MSDKHHIDKIFKDKLYSYRTEYNDAAWEKMEQLLEKKRKKRAALWFFGTFLTIAVLVTAGLNFYNWKPSSKPSAPVNAAEETKTPALSPEIKSNKHQASSGNRTEETTVNQDIPAAKNSNTFTKT